MAYASWEGFEWAWSPEPPWPPSPQPVAQQAPFEPIPGTAVNWLVVTR